MHSYISTACSPRAVVMWWDSMQDSPIINERVLIDAKLKSSTVSTSRSSSLTAPFPDVSGLLRSIRGEFRGRGRGCVYERGQSSHNGGRRAVRDHYQIRKSRPSKKRRNFPFPSSPQPTIFLSQLSSLSLVVGRSQSEFQGQSSTGRIDLPFCRAVSIGIVPFHFLLIGYHAQRRALST